MTELHTMYKLKTICGKDVSNITRFPAGTKTSLDDGAPATIHVYLVRLLWSGRFMQVKPIFTRQRGAVSSSIIVVSQMVLLLMVTGTSQS